MIAPSIPHNETERLRSLRELRIVDAILEDAYNNIVELASYICNTPIAFVSFIDEKEQWLRARKNIKVENTSRDESFCGHAILNPDELFEVEDATLDDRFLDNPYVTKKTNPIIFYASVPLLDRKGLALGTLCVVDSKRNKLTNEQKVALQSLGHQVEILLEAHRKNIKLEKLKKKLEAKNKVLEEFTSIVTHDLKMPLANMILTADIMKKKYSKALDEEGIEYLSYMKNSGLLLSDYINGLLEYYSSDSTATQINKEFFLNDLLEDIIDLLRISDDCEIILPENNMRIIGNQAALGQVFLNLISNSLKYNENKKIIVEIDCREDRDNYYFSVKDNGIGIPVEKQADIFDLFKTVADRDRSGKKGHGIGLSTVKKLLKSLGGDIKLTSKPGEGSLFEFSIISSESLD